MVAFILPANSATGGYEIDNSLRFNNPDDPNLSTTFSSAGNRRTFTISAWVKRGNIADDHTLFGQGGTSSGNPRGVLFFANSLRFTNNTAGNSTDTDVETNAKTRDPSAWYHAVVAVDTTQGTNSNRVKLYLNGELQTSLANSTYPDQNFEMGWNNNVLHTVGRYPNNDAYHMDGYISEFYFIDGTQYAASDFGETNNNGVWIPKDAKGDLTFGTNGFYLEFQQTGTGTNASGMGADTSGNDNHLAVNNLAATDVTVDTPTNNFATLNSITPATNDLSEGNTVSNLDNGTIGTSTTQFAANGKWYAEFKVTDLASDNANIRIGVCSAEQNAVDLGGPNETYAFLGDGRTYVEGSASSYGAGLSADDIVMVALDTDNSKVWYGINGTWLESGTVGDPAGNSNASHAIDAGPAFGFAIASGSGSATPIIQCNFGNPAFAISSSNADANGYGNFEYAVPSGFYSLCTKNLAEFG